MRIWLLMMLSCGGEDTPGDVLTPAPPKVIAPVAPAKALAHAQAAEVAVESGWGAVFWRDGQAWKTGGGNLVVGPDGARATTAIGSPNVCDGVALKGAMAKTMLAVPEGTAVPEIQKTPAIRAHLVERSAWRLDEVLPPRDKYSPAVNSSAPSQQRGVSVGSVAKTRRHGAPPLLLATGVRDCTAAVTVLDAKAERTLAYDRIPDVCEKLRVLPASQLDAGPEREFAVFNDTNVVLYRLIAKGSRVQMSRIGQWQCDK